ncbi:MAG TPA: type III-B CRISPR module RAMP protein Cmr1 [Candidatus Marinimicrobia bacterium]|nr:type III-B CRISPR module RAMP protein Cmr1 [Candidatus Neomarinimicrobiota bacterium]
MNKNPMEKNKQNFVLSVPSVVKKGDIMIKKEVQFETITPLFTGDVKREMTEIKPASIMGSLRFWFEVICHFSGRFNTEKYSKEEFDYNKYERLVEKNPSAADDEICEQLQLSPVARYFGCTGWKSKIGFEKIYLGKDENKFIYPQNKKLVSGKNWYLPNRYFEGKFTVVFTTESTEIAENILWPLLNFIQEYGFLGVKNNIGFGRVRIICDGLESYQELKIDGKNFYPSQIVNEVNQKYKMINFNTICYYKLENVKSEYFVAIKKLLSDKSRQRSNEKSWQKRHYIFGSINNDSFSNKIGVKTDEAKGPNATKIIPLIRNKDIGFLGIPGIIHLPEV